MRISDWSSDVCSSDLLTERDVAIVTAIPGTTRDRIEAHLAIRGVPFVAIDTAGLRETGDVVEREGIARARAAVATADIVLAMAGEDGRFEPVETQAPVIRVMSRSDLSRSEEHTSELQSLMRISYA